jgi:hypothetical protein
MALEADARHATIQLLPMDVEAHFDDQMGTVL